MLYSCLSRLKTGRTLVFVRNEKEKPDYYLHWSPYRAVCIPAMRTYEADASLTFRQSNQPLCSSIKQKTWFQMSWYVS